MESSIIIPETQPLPVDTVALYQQRLLKARVRTQEDLDEMSDEDVEKLYLKNEQIVIDKMFINTWTRSVARLLPIDNELRLEASLMKDIFLKEVVNEVAKEYFPSFYYDYGAYLAPFTFIVFLSC